MNSSRTALTLSTLAFTVSIHTVANAKETVGLSFDLQSDPHASAQGVNPSAPHLKTTPLSPPVSSTDGDRPLPIPAAAANPPIAGQTTVSAGGKGGSHQLTWPDQNQSWTSLPAPPEASAQREVPHQPSSAQRSHPPRPRPSAAGSTAVDPIDPILLGFDLTDTTAQTSTATGNTSIGQSTGASQAVPTEIMTHLFRGHSESLVARAVGSAEGTRTPEGHKTPAYFGHRDPGNQAWNLGTFSYQHGAQTPEEADAKQLARLQSQTLTLKGKAQARGMDLSLEELLNGIDLANQAPKAALDHEGYIEWLAEARRLGMTGSEAITWARTRSFLDPDTQRWNAPGLGNTIDSIARDQSRRVRAIAKATDLTATMPRSQAPHLQTRTPSLNTTASASKTKTGLTFDRASMDAAPDHLTLQEPPSSKLDSHTSTPHSSATTTQSLTPSANSDAPDAADALASEPWSPPNQSVKEQPAKGQPFSPPSISIPSQVRENL